MVVIVILCVLCLLLSPAIQSAREASRASACRNNLKQIGLALHNFESAHRYFPKGAEGRYDQRLSSVRMYGLSWWAEILPFLEESAISDQLDRQGVSTGWAQLNSHNGALADGYGPKVFFCPTSDVQRFVAASRFQIAAPSYAGISGATNDDGFPEDRVSRCCRSEGQISAGGLLVPNDVVAIRHVEDGLSKTLLVGEQSDFAYTLTGQRRPIGAAFVNGWLTGTKALGTPPTYGDWLSPSYNLTTVRYPLNEHRYDLPGIYEDIGANNPMLSAHPGIVNLLFGDGSVQSTADDLNITVLKSQATRDDAEASTRAAPLPSAN